MCRRTCLRKLGVRSPSQSPRIHGQLRAGSQTGAGHHVRAQRGLEPGPRPAGERVHLIPRHPQRVRQVRAVELVPQVQLDDFLVSRFQLGQRGQHHLTLPGLLQGRAEIGGRLTGAELVVGQRDGGPMAVQPAPALVPGHRVQPGPQPARVTQQRQLHLGHHEGVADRPGRVGWLTQQRSAIRIQRRSELIVGRRQRGRIARHDRRHQFPVTHAINAMASREFSD